VLFGGGAAVLVAVYALYKRSSAASSTAATTGTTAATPSAYDSTLTDMENQMENQIAALQAQIANLQPTPNTGTTLTGPGRLWRPPLLQPGGLVDTAAPIPTAYGPVAVPASAQTRALTRVQASNTLPGVAARSTGLFNNIPQRSP
jgi:hypothetical protein